MNWKKNFLLIVMTFSILLITISSATAQPQTPEQLYEVDISGHYDTLPSVVKPVILIRGSHIALTQLGSSSSSGFIRIVNLENNQSVYSISGGGSSGSTTSAFYKDGYIYFFKAMSSSFGSTSNYRIIDVSNFAFVEAVASGTINLGSSPITARSTIRDSFFLNTVSGEVGSITNRFRHLFYNGTGGVNIPLDQRIPNSVEGSVLFSDEINRIMASGNQLYDYSPTPTNNANLIYTLPAGSGSFLDFNRNSVQPRWITSNGNYVLVTDSDYSEILVSSATVENPLFIFDDDNIIGHNGTHITINSFDQEEGITTLQTNIEYNPSTMFANRDSTRMLIMNRNTGVVRLYLFDIEDPTDLIIPNKPVPELEFLGLDSVGRWVFKATMTASEDQTGYYSMQLFDAQSDPQGGATETFRESVRFTSDTDLNLLDGLVVDWCEPYEYGTTQDGVFTDGGEGIAYGGGFGTQPPPAGAYFQDATGVDSGFSCNQPVNVNFPQRITTEQNDVIELSTSFHNEMSGSGNMEYSFAFYDGNQLIAQFLIEDDRPIGGATTRNVSYWNGTAFEQIGNHELGISQARAFTTFRGIYNITAGTIEIDLFGAGNLAFNERPVTSGTIINVPSGSNAEGVDRVRFNQISTGFDFWFYIDYTSVSWEGESLVAPAPPYQVFAELTGGQGFSRDLRFNPIDGKGEFGSYGARMYSTNLFSGLNDYSLWTEILFSYNINTPVLTEAEIKELINQDVVSGEFTVRERVEGDLITDWFFSFLDRIGVKTDSSRFFVGLLITILGTGFGVVVAGVIGAGIGGLLTLFWVSWIGLIPVWIGVSMAVISGILAGVVMRQVMIGRGRGGD
jgi:hypothetical protein